MKCGQMEEEFACLLSPVAKGGTECPQLSDLGRFFFFKEKRLDQTGKDCLNIRFRYFLFYLP